MPFSITKDLDGSVALLEKVKSVMVCVEYATVLGSRERDRKSVCVRL